MSNTTYFALGIGIHRSGADSNKINGLRCHGLSISYMINEYIFPQDIPKKSKKSYLRHSSGVDLARFRLARLNKKTLAYDVV